MSELIFPKAPFTKIKVNSNKGAKIDEIKIYSFNSIWNNN